MTTIGSLFSGTGGLDMGVQQVIPAEVIWHSDIKPAAVKLLAHRFPGVPNLGDITGVDWDAVVRPDIVTGGFPCGDISTAGKRLGMIRDGHGKTRSGLWAEMHRAISILRPGLVVAENVRAIVSAKADSDVEPCPGCVGDGSGDHMRALGAVLADLADIGYDAAWYGLRAADVGAPHGRWRVFICAWPAVEDTDGAGGGERRHAAPGQETGGRSWGDTRRRSGTPTAHPEGIGWGEGRPEPARLVGRPDDAVGGAGTVADADNAGLEGRPAERQRSGQRAVGSRGVATADASGVRRAGRIEPQPDLVSNGSELAHDREERGDRQFADWGAYAPAVRRWGAVLGRPAPAPTETGRHGGQRLSPWLTEWMMGLPHGWICDVPGLSRNDKLSLAGDGVVPQQAAEALRRLLPHIAVDAA